MITINADPLRKQKYAYVMADKYPKHIRDKFAAMNLTISTNYGRLYDSPEFIREMQMSPPSIAAEMMRQADELSSNKHIFIGGVFLPYSKTIVLNVAPSASLQRDLSSYSLVHELGHAVDNAYALGVATPPPPGMMQFAPKDFVLEDYLDQNKHFLSSTPTFQNHPPVLLGDYGQDSAAEYFAECVRLYTNTPAIETPIMLPEALRTKALLFGIMRVTSRDLEESGMETFGVSTQRDFLKVRNQWVYDGIDRIFKNQVKSGENPFL